MAKKSQKCCWLYLWDFRFDNWLYHGGVFFAFDCCYLVWIVWFLLLIVVCCWLLVVWLLLLIVVGCVGVGGRQLAKPNPMTSQFSINSMLDPTSLVDLTTTLVDTTTSMDTTINFTTCTLSSPSLPLSLMYYKCAIGNLLMYYAKVLFFHLQNLAHTMQINWK